MARKRYPLAVTGSGASAVSGGNIRMTKNNWVSGDAISNGYTQNIMVDQNTAISNYTFYYDNSFQHGDMVAVRTGTLPTGLSETTDTDSGGTIDIGYVQVTGTPSDAPGTYEWLYTITDPYDNSTAIINFKMIIAPVGTTPVWGTTAIAFDRILRNTAAPQQLSAGPTTSYANAVYSISAISGFATGVIPQVDSATGAVTVANTPDVTAAATAHSYTVTADLGEYGTQSNTFTGNVSYGDPYGARYFGPANSDTNYTGGQNAVLSEADSQARCNPAKSSGALKRVYNAQPDTSPYNFQDGYGCEYSNNMQGRMNDSTADDVSSAYVKNGYVGHEYTSNYFWNSPSNHQSIKFTWTVPNGVTSFSAVAIGGGSSGAYNWANNGSGGGGLAWMNGISCTPGETFTVGVGLGCFAYNSYVGSYGGGNSFLIRNSSGNCLIFAQGGGYTGYANSNPNGQSTSYFQNTTIQGIENWDKGHGYNYNNSQDGGGWGVRSSEGSTVNDGAGGSGGNNWHYGGGAAKYTSSYHGMPAGGYRGNWTAGEGEDYNGYYGSGGSGNYYSSTYGTAGGGGTGADGQGQRGSRYDGRPDGSADAGCGYGGDQYSPNSYPNGSSNYRGGAGGGSGGSRSTYGHNQYSSNSYHEGNTSSRWYNMHGGMHGGGGGGSGTSNGGGGGGPGCVRIIWGVAADGSTRCFPYNYASENPNMKVAGMT